MVSELEFRACPGRQIRADPCGSVASLTSGLSIGNVLKFWRIALRHKRGVANELHVFADGHELVSARFHGLDEIRKHRRGSCQLMKGKYVRVYSLSLPLLNL